jgi:hypothetical protein
LEGPKSSTNLSAVEKSFIENLEKFIGSLDQYDEFVKFLETGTGCFELESLCL